VEEQIRVFQSRLAAPNPQHLDVLTGLGNRQAVEEQITRRMESGKAFTLLLFEAEGPVAADQVLVQAASRLAGQVRAHDYVGRWAANEFAIVMECPLEIAEPRSQEIARWLSGTYVLRGGAMETQVNVTFTVRVVDPSESAASAREESATAPLPA
jgi:GGDEF domain-containing protein